MFIKPLKNKTYQSNTYVYFNLQIEVAYSILLRLSVNRLVTNDETELIDLFNMATRLSIPRVGRTECLCFR